MPSDGPIYEGMRCPTCANEDTLVLELELERAIVSVRCAACGISEIIAGARRCDGPSCDTWLFMGGKSGKVPVSVTTGANHFEDCPDAARFRNPNR